MGPENPRGNAFVMDVTQLKTEGESQRRMDMSTSRAWSVASADKTNSLGDPTAYTLVTGENSIPYLTTDAPVRRR